MKRELVISTIFISTLFTSTLFTCGLSIIATSSFVLAAPIYKSETSDGKIIYSSKPIDKDSKAAELPPIMRAQMKLPKQDQISCATHGGANCQLGPDSDGSVICYDGFRGAATRFRFTCNAPKLEISDVSELTAEGNFSVFVRNSRSVKAAAPSVSFKPEGSAPIKLSGPNEIEAFGMAEFVYHAPANSAGTELAMLRKPDLTQLDVACGNCP